MIKNIGDHVIKLEPKEFWEFICKHTGIALTSKKNVNKACNLFIDDILELVK